MKKSFLILLCLALVATACGGSAEETVEEPVATEEVETSEEQLLLRRLLIKLFLALYLARNKPNY